MFHTLGRVLLPQSSEPMRAESQQHQGFLPRPSNPGLQHPAQRNNTLVEQCWTNTRHTHARTHTHIHTRKHTHTHTPKLHVSHIDTKVVESERERERARERERERERESTLQGGPSCLPHALFIWAFLRAPTMGPSLIVAEELLYHQQGMFWHFSALSPADISPSAAALLGR